MKVAIVPGSFDPMTLGHLDIIKRAASLFDEVVVAVMINGEKSYKFSMSERLEIAELTCAGIANVRVVSDSGTLISLAQREGACAIVKGARNAEDFEYEEKMARYNSARDSRIQTVILFCDEKLADVSSTEVRKRLAEGRDISDIVSKNAFEYIIKRA